MDVLGDGARIVELDGDWRHDAGAALAVQDDRSDQFACPIVEDHWRAEKIWTALVAAAQIRTVTGAAVDTIQSGSARN
jgi:hypothetical protein